MACSDHSSQFKQNMVDAWCVNCSPITAFHSETLLSGRVITTLPTVRSWALRQSGFFAMSTTYWMTFLLVLLEMHTMFITRQTITTHSFLKNVGSSRWVNFKKVEGRTLHECGAIVQEQSAGIGRPRTSWLSSRGFGTSSGNSLINAAARHKEQMVNWFTCLHGALCCFHLSI